MTKADIINKIAESTGLQKKDVSVVVESFMENIKNSLLTKKENVYLRGFGSFIVKHRLGQERTFACRKFYFISGTMAKNSASSAVRFSAQCVCPHGQ